jgi:hypothetical protein
MMLALYANTLAHDCVSSLVPRAVIVMLLAVSLGTSGRWRWGLCVCGVMGTALLFIPRSTLEWSHISFLTHLPEGYVEGGGGRVFWAWTGLVLEGIAVLASVLVPLLLLRRRANVNYEEETQNKISHRTVDPQRVNVR